MRHGSPAKRARSSLLLLPLLLPLPERSSCRQISGVFSPLFHGPFVVLTAVFLALVVVAVVVVVVGANKALAADFPFPSIMAGTNAVFRTDMHSADVTVELARRKGRAVTAAEMRGWRGVSLRGAR